MMNFRILPEHQLLLMCIWGKPSFEEIQTKRQEIRKSLDLSQDFNAILDVNHIEEWFSGNELRSFSKSTTDDFLAGKKLAVIASSDLAFGMNRMFQSMADLKSPLEISVCRDLSSALKWLGREGIEIENIFEKLMKEEK